MPRNVLIEVRRDTAANWTATNPVLAAGEPGWETNTNKLKIGDGVTAWNALAYFSPGGAGTISSLTSTGGTITVGNPAGPTTNVDLPASGVAAATYGDSSHVAQVTFDAQGRATAAASVAIPGVGSGGSVLIYDYTVTGAVKASIDTNVDGALAGLFATTYNILEVLLVARTDEAVELSVVDFTFNNDTGAHYDRAVLVSTAIDTSVSMSQAVGESKLQVVLAGASMTAGIPGIANLTIPGYAGTTFHKVGQLSAGVTDNVASTANRQWRTGAFHFNSTAALTRIKVAPDTAAKNLAIGSRLMVFAR